jgi:glucose-6-phosphate 1-dehydrogenase
MLDRFVILGANGDLTARYLAPAIVQIQEAGRLPHSIQITGVARQDWTTEQFRGRIADALERHAGNVSLEARRAVLESLDYQRADVTDAEALSRALPADGRPSLVYLALPPAVFPRAVETFDRMALPAGSRIVVEKPFGESLASARELNQLVQRVFPENAVYRIDHFLGKQTIQNLLGLRFANRIFEPVWNCHHVSQVDIIWDETLGLEGRAGYYDHAGALKDMIQNHLLQLLCFVAMEPPIELSEHELRDRKVQLLRAVRRMSPEDVGVHTYRARYAAGTVDGRELPNYADEPGVDPSRQTETFAAVRLRIDNWRWSGVPFMLRSGKGLGRDRRLINVYFHEVPHLTFGQESDPSRNVLRMSIDPDWMSLDLNVNCPGDPFELRPVALDLELAPPTLSAYALLLLDVLEGDPMLFIRDDEAEELWRIIEPILQGWEMGLTTLREYPAGSQVDTNLETEP